MSARLGACLTSVDALEWAQSKVGSSIVFKELTGCILTSKERSVQVAVESFHRRLSS